ncbi:MAG: DNA-processing protein DprA [Chloroflexota bacterium]
MSIHHPLTTDGLAILALTSRFAAGGGRTAKGQTGLKPLTAREWSQVAGALAGAGATPSALLGQEAADLAGLLGQTAISTDAIARLVGRATVLAMEAERLVSRGIWLVTLADDAYPKRLRARLGDSAPPVLYGAGSVELLDAGGMAIVGARDADEAAVAFATEAASSVARSGQPVVSGGARGIDAAAMTGAIEAGGSVVGIIAESLERQTRSAAIRALVADERLALISPYGSDVPFSVGAAMGRNRLIYCLADVALVVSASQGEGGTWAGATEALKARWVPIYVRTGDDMPAGNAALVALGAHAYDGDPAGVTGLPIRMDGYPDRQTEAEPPHRLIAEQPAFFDIDPEPAKPKATRRVPSRARRKSTTGPRNA